MSRDGAERGAPREPQRLRRRGLIAVSCATSVVALWAYAAAWAQSSGGAYVLDPRSIAGGGGRATGGAFALEGTISQHDASNVLAGGPFELTGGFHQRAKEAAGNGIFGNGFEGP